MWGVAFRTLFRSGRFSGIAVTVFATVVVVATAAETVLFDRTGTSASIMGRSPVYAIDAFHFSDIDGDGEEEFIGIEFTESFPKEYIATVSRWLGDGQRLVEWRTFPLKDRHKLLVGNVDNDPHDEIVLFGEGYFVQPGETTLIVADWVRSRYEVLPSATLSGRVGALVDVDGDGRDEFITVENSHSGHVSGQVSIYRVDTDRGIELIFRENRLVDSVEFLRVFSSGGVRYLFVEGSSDLWKAVFRIEELPEGYELIPQSANQPDVFRDALRSTMAFSAERGAMVRYIDRRMLEFVPVESP